MNKQQFDKHIAGKKRVVIKFFADWCPDCKRMAFFIESVLKEFSSFTFYQINRDNFPELTEQYEVMEIPSLLVFKNGIKIGHLHSANAKTPEEVTDFLAGYFTNTR